MSEFKVHVIDDPTGLLPRNFTLKIKDHGVDICDGSQCLHTFKISHIKDVGYDSSELYFTVRVNDVLKRVLLKTNQYKIIYETLYTVIAKKLKELIAKGKRVDRGGTSSGNNTEMLIQRQETCIKELRSSFSEEISRIGDHLCGLVRDYGKDMEDKLASVTTQLRTAVEDNVKLQNQLEELKGNTKA